jgi:hypothetical protein
MIFFGAARHGYGHAFSLSLIALGALLLGVAALSRLMPGRPAVVPAPVAVVSGEKEYSLR